MHENRKTSEAPAVKPGSRSAGEGKSHTAQYQTDADRFLENLQECLRKFGLELHPDKTRRIEFGRFAEENRKRRGEDKPETFDFLGFQPISGKNSLGRFTVRRTTIRKRMRAKLRQIKQELDRRMHDPVPQTGGWLKSVVQGYFNYYAVPGNLESLAVFRDGLLGHWWRALRRRSQKHRLSWTRMLTGWSTRGEGVSLKFQLPTRGSEVCARVRLGINHWRMHDPLQVHRRDRFQPRWYRH
jgi:hypothetical protein